MGLLQGRVAFAAGTIARRDPARTLRRMVGAAAALTALLVVGAAWWTFTRASSELLANDLATASAIAQIVDRLPTEDRPAAIADLNGRGAVALLTADGQLVPADLGTGREGPLWQRWSGLVVRTSQVRSSFSSVDPDGTEWRHVTVPLSDDGQILLKRPAPTPWGVPTVVVWGFASAGAALAVFATLAWMAVRRGFVDPFDRLIGASVDLRWQGRLRPAEQERLGRLAHRRDRVGRLAGSLLAVDDDLSRNFLQLSTLLETSRIVAASLDTEDVFSNILQQTKRLLGIERCAVLSLDAQANIFVIRASLGLSDYFVNELQVAPTAPDSPAMRALRSGQPVQISDTASDLSYAGFRDRSEREGYRSILAVPLTTAMAPPAVLLLYKSEPYRYSYAELELATSFAGFASLAMENAALYARIDKRLQEQTRRLEAIVESLDDGLILADPDGAIAYHNPAAAKLLGVDVGHLVGASTDQLLGRLGTAAATMDQSAEPAAPVVVTTGADGERRDVRIRSFVVSDKHGAPLGQGQLWQDITQDRAIERIKSALMTTVSHELRTPLANIKGYVSTLLADDVEWGIGEQREFLTTISNETDRLTRLVRDVLDLSRIEAGMVVLAPETVLPVELMSQVVAGLDPREQERVRLDAAGELGHIELDRARVEIAVRNLLDNALKFSPPDSPVDLVARSAEDALVVSVRDRGPGIAQELRDRIFDSFVRGDDGLTRQAGGVGLGLAICRGFVEAHGGRVWVEEAQPGARFCLAIPARGSAGGEQNEEVTP